jgi:hypothetical protein
VKSEPPGDQPPDERSTTASGLGRGLSGILGDVAGHEPSREVSELLGSVSRRDSPGIRRLVTELAADSISNGFAAEGVLMARRSADGTIDPLQTRLGSTWSTNDPFGFEVNGRLWQTLEREIDETRQFEIGPSSVLFARHQLGTSVMATAVVRSTPFDEAEQAQLGGLFRSAARAIEVDTAIPEKISLRVLVTPSGDRFLADVRLVDGTARRHGASVADTEDRAVAQAAVELCDLPLDVRFAGSTLVDDDDVSIVVLDGDSGPVFGLAITGRMSSSGLVEATFAAAACAGADPFSLRAEV